MEDMNILALLIVAIFNLGFGMLWYSKLLFGKAWMNLSGVSQEGSESSKGKKMIVPMSIGFVKGLVMSFALYYVIIYLGIYSIIEGALIALLLWLGFVVASSLDTVLWEKKSLKLFFINISYYAVVLLVSGGIFGIW